MNRFLRRMLPVSLAAACIVPGACAQQGPEAVAGRYITAVNAGDMMTIGGLIADDVARSDFIGCTPAMNNKECLVFYIRTTVVGQHGTIKVLHSERRADEVHARLELRTDGTRHAGVERAVGTDIIGVRDGKIVSFRFAPDFADGQTVTFFRSLGIGPGAGERR